MTYGVPSIAFGVDAAFSYKYNQQRGVCDKDGLALCPGFTTAHVIPVFFLCYLPYLRVLYVKEMSLSFLLQIIIVALHPHTHTQTLLNLLMLYVLYIIVIIVIIVANIIYLLVGYF